MTSEAREVVEDLVEAPGATSDWPVGRPQLQVLSHEGAGAVESALPAWNAVLTSMPSTLAFNRPAWASTWLRFHGGRRRIIILEIRDPDRPVGILPLQISHVPLLGLRRLEFLSGSAATLLQWLINPEHVGYAFYNDVLIVPGFEQAVCAEIRRWLQARHREWDVLRLTCSPADSPLSRLTAQMEGWSPAVEEQRKYRVHTGDGWEAFKSALSKRQRRHIRYEPHALERALGGELSLERVVTAAAPQAMDDFLNLLRKRWAAKQRYGITGRDAAFYQELARHPDLGVVAFFLTGSGRPVAAQVGFDNGRRYIPFGLAFDPGFDRASPAQVLMQFVIRRCCDDDHDEVDFGGLKAVEQWTDDSRLRVNVAATSPRLIAKARARVFGCAGRAIVGSQRSFLVRHARRALARRAANRFEPSPTVPSMADCSSDT